MANEIVRNVDVVEMVSKFFSGEDPTDKIRYEQVRTSKQPDPDKKMWLAVLEAGLQDYQKGLNSSSRRERNNFQEAFDWIFNPSPEEENWPGSFDNVCDKFTLESSYVRKLLINWTKVNHGKVPEKESIYVSNPKGSCLGDGAPVDEASGQMFESPRALL